MTDPEIHLDLHATKQALIAGARALGFSSLGVAAVEIPEDEQHLVRWLRARPDDEAGIVYAGSRANAEKLADALCAAGLPALAYHAGLDSATRGQRQETFIRDDVRVMCATIAFGMGIDKSNVRFVVHWDVPRSLEGYYQETGRAGRDGLPAECAWFFAYGDVARAERFVEEKPESERAAARDQLERVKRYAYSNDCRRRELLAYFGETYPRERCESSLRKRRHKYCLPCVGSTGRGSRHLNLHGMI